MGGLEARGRYHPRQIIENAILFLLLGLGLYLLVPKFIGERKMIGVIRHANFLLTPFAVAVEALSMLSVCFLYYELQKVGGGNLPFRRIALIYMSAYAFGHIVPGGNAGTVYLNYRELRREGLPRGLTVQILAAANIFYSAALIVLLIAGLLLSLVTWRFPIAYNIAALFIASGAVLFMAFCVFVLGRETFFNRIAGWMVKLVQRLGLFRDHREEALKTKVLGIRKYVYSLFTTCQALVRKGLYALGFWLMDMACLFIVFTAIGYPMNPGFIIISYTVADVVASLPVTPAGLGTFELSMGAILYAYGYPKEILAIAVLAFRFFSYWLCTFAGGICYIFLNLDRRYKMCPGKKGVMAGQAVSFDVDAGSLEPVKSGCYNLCDEGQKKTSRRKR